MTQAPRRLYLFGDQTYDVTQRQEELLRHRANTTLDSFLCKAYGAIRREIYSLSPQIRDNLHSFTCLEDLLLSKRNGKTCTPLDLAVTCIHQLGYFILHEDSTFQYPNTGSERVLGTCTGALAAAAVSCSRSTLELVPLAVQAVITAFRIGVRVSDFVQRIEPTQENVQSWSMVVAHPAAAQVVEEFCEQSTLALTKKPYISVFGPRAITVSGPPSSLSQLRNFRSFEKFSSTGIPIHGPYHSGHLAFPSDVEHILQDLAPQLSALTCRIPIVSSLGDTTLNGDFGTLLADAVRNILIHPIRWPWVIEELRTWLGTPEHTDGASTPFEIVAIASNQVHFLYDSLDRKWPQSTPSPMMVPSRTFGSPHALGESEMDSSYQPKLAIIGMSGRFPSAKDNEAFWNLLYQGLDVSKPVPPLHWNSSTHVDPTGKAKNTSQTPFGCWLDDPAAFDARFFNISPREAIQMDPAQRIALMTAYEAIEQAGIIPDATPSTRRDRVGVYYGVTSNDWMETNSAQDIDTYFIPGGNRAFIPGRINYFFKFSGPSYAVDTACSSSLASIHLACNALWQGQIDMAIAGGTNVLTNPDFTAGLDRGHFLSRTGNCKTFDDDADGYCRGEGIGTVIIKRLDDAIADNDPVLGVILDAQTNHSAEAESITRPHAKAQCFLFRSMLHRSLLDPYDVSYVEMHGTGTQAGDATEMDSVLGSFAPPLDVVKRGRSTNQALYLGSAKSNIGHGEAASGVSSLIKVLLMMQKNIIVPHCGIKSAINRKFPTNLEERNVRITTQPVPWIQTSRASKPRRAFVNNFSAAGGNSALLLEEAPIVQDGPSLNEDTRTVHLVAISAKHPNSLQGNLRSLLETLKQRPNLRLDQLSYTTTVRRVHHPFRVMLAGSRLEEIHDQVEMAIQDGLGMKRAIGIPRLVFMFTGNGAQYPGMGKHLFECFSCFRVEICRLDQIGRSLGFPSILSVIHSDEKDIAVFSPLAVQLATTCIQIALTRLWASWNVLPVAVVGHSLGEYAALNVAGVLSDADVVYLVGRRAQLLEDKCTQGTHSMLVVKSSVESIAAVLTNTKCEVACVNSPIETVIAGPNDEIALFRSLLTDAGMRATLLMVPYAFHSSQVDVIMDPFETIATSVTYAKPQLPILCPLDGSVITSEGKINAQYLSRHCREPVNFRAALTTACREKIVTNDTTTLEIGPHPAMTGMVRAEMPRVASLTSMQRGKPIFQILTATLKTLYCAGADIRWSEYLRDLKASHRVIPLPAYSWDLKDYWMQYVNDWSLRKGDPPQVIAASDGPKLGSTTIHRIVEESHETDKSRIVVEANIAREDLRPLVQGHEVDNVPLCTPSVYADIALSLGTYLLDRIRPNKTERVIDITRMTISKALILRPDIAEQLLQAHADADWNSNSVSIKFMSFSTKNKLQAHAQCLVRFEDHSLQKSLQRHGSELQQQLNRLRDGIATFDTVRFNRSMVYRMIRPLARFHDDYRAIQEVVLNNKTLEASSKLSFSSINSEGIFHTHPAIIDALSQSCGFVMNCKDSTDLDIEVYMNHGWEGFQIFKPIELDKEYTTYTRMHEGVDNLWHGDVAVFEGDDVVASLQQVTMQGVPRKVLKVILSIESGAKSQKQPGAPKVAPSSVVPTPAKTIPIPGSLVASTSRPAQAVPSKAAGDSQMSKVLCIIAEESGLDVVDLTIDLVFSDAGIDSLMGLTISARLKEELDLDIDFDDFFFTYPTVKSLQVLLETPEMSTDMINEMSDRSSSSDSGATRSSPLTPPDTSAQMVMTGALDKSSAFRSALDIVSEESGVAVDDYYDSTRFDETGIDSLLSLIIVSRLRDELEIEMPHESFFLECPTVLDLRNLLETVVSGSNGMVEAPTTGQKSALTEAHMAMHEHATLAEPVEAFTKSSDVIASSASRKEAVRRNVERHTAGFLGPTYSTSRAITTQKEIVILVTGATGGLGTHLADHLAHLSNVKTVVCLNRKSQSEGLARQQKAMRDKGIRFPETLMHKLQVLQVDSSEVNLGLSESDYNALADSVTHIIHNAWPMSAKRPLSGFESQFQVMRNLIDLACEAASRRPESFKFSFQMVSSIGVVGNYNLGSKTRIIVPEQRVDIDSVLPNGYGEAKWGCEWMLDLTLHRYPHRFRSMAVRLGQIAGSKTSGYWNPMEHFGFLVKSSQTLNFLPDMEGGLYWTTVNDIAGSLSDLVLADNAPYPIYHIENPLGQQWREMTAILADALHIASKNVIPFPEWLQKVRDAPQKNNPASSLADFLEDNFLRMSCGGLVLDTRKTMEHSATLRAVTPVSETVARKYIHIWREIGFLNSTNEDKALFDEDRARLWART